MLLCNHVIMFIILVLLLIYKMQEEIPLAYYTLFYSLIFFVLLFFQIPRNNKSFAIFGI